MARGARGLVTGVTAIVCVDLRKLSLRFTQKSKWYLPIRRENYDEAFYYPCGRRDV